MESLGVRFVPSDQELVEYLRHYDGGRKLPSFGAINEAFDPYSYDPEILRSSSDERGNVWYCYADRGAEGRRTRDDRGYWKSTDGIESIPKGGTGPIGYKRNLRFYSGKKNSKSKPTKCVMTEYTLRPDTSRGAGKAICVIRMTEEKQGNEVGQASTSEATNQPLPNYTNYHVILETLAADLGVDYK